MKKVDSNTDETFQAAVAHLQAGRLAEAEQGLRRVLEADSRHAGGYYYLAHIAKRAGHLEAARDLAGRVLELQPENARGYHFLGSVLKAEGRLEDAIDSFRRATDLQPDYPVAFNNLGNACKELGRMEEAEDSYRRALEMAPDTAATHNNLGVALIDLGGKEEAVACFERALELQPDYTEAHNNLGAALLGLGRVEDAVSCFEAALTDASEQIEVLNNLAVALRGLNRFDESLIRSEHAIQINPDDPAGHNNLGRALHEMGRLDEAVAAFENALGLDPASSGVHNNLGNVHIDRGGYDQAIENFRRELEINPDDADAHNNLGVVQTRIDHLDEAIGNLERAIELDPGYPEAHNNLGNALVLSRRLGDAIDCYRRALALKPDYVSALSNLIFALDMDPRASSADQLAERRRWNEIHVRPLADQRRPPDNDPTPQRRLRVGYVSADFRHHSAAYLFGPALLHHDRDNFDVYCYSNSTRKDDLTARFRNAVQGWRSIIGKTDADVADMIRSDGIDILIDLAGHSMGNRLLVFARKPAPVQVTAWGHATGTGIETMDYLFSDKLLLPEGTRQYVGERIIDLPCAFGYLCPDDAPAVAPLPAHQRGQITFGCFNRMEKVSPEALDLWSELLRAVPGARLILKDKPLSQQPQRERVMAEFTARGIEPERIDLIGHTSWADHMAAYGGVDIALDPFPHNGGTTTMESLWMGIPVVTLKGATSSGRATASILGAAGFADWIADTGDAYLAIAGGLASDMETLAETRRRLRGKLAASPVGHAPTYVAAIEEAYRAMWREWCEGQY